MIAIFSEAIYTVKSKHLHRALGCEINRDLTYLGNFTIWTKNSAISIISSQRDFFNHMTEHTPILKNSQNTYYSHSIFTPEKIKHSKKNVSFLLLQFLYWGLDQSIRLPLDKRRSHTHRNVVWCQEMFSRYRDKTFFIVRFYFFLAQEYFCAVRKISRRTLNFNSHFLAYWFSHFCLTN